MRITGDGVWGPPKDKPGALATLRRAVELDVNLIDTADSYGPYVSEELIAEALFPYPAGLVIATKGGWERVGPGQWIAQRQPTAFDRGARRLAQRLKLGPHRYLPAPHSRPRRLLRGLRRDARPPAHRRQDPPRRALERHEGAHSTRAEDRPHRLRAEPLQLRRPRVGLHRRLLRAARHRLLPVGSARSGARGARRHQERSRSSPRNAAASRARMAAQALEGHHPHPRHLQREAS